MAKRPKDPSPYLSQVSGVDPEIVSQDYNLFYRPDVKPMNKAVNSLIMSLSNIVPTLANYQITEDIKTKKADEARAVEDFETNKKSFNDLIKNEKIPEGASPFYYNKMMELDLQSKARLFKKKFDNYYAENDLSNSLNINAFGETYEEQLKAFYKEQGLDKYDPLALNNAFFNTTSAFRNERYQQHSAKIMQNIKKQTETSFTHNISGLIIDGQDDEKTAGEVLTDLKGLTDGLISVGTNKARANDLFIMGLNKYIETVSDDEGFAFAGDILEELKTFQLGTGKFGGSAEGSSLIQEMELELASKHISFLEGKAKKEKVKDELFKESLSNTYWDEKNGLGEEFNIQEFIDQTLEQDGEYRFSPEAKEYLRILHNANEKALAVIVDDQEALTELMILQDEDIYSLKDKAFELLQDGKLTNTTFQKFYNSANTYNLIKNNTYFTNSLPYQNYLNIFKDIDISGMPILKSELPLIKLKFQKELWEWFQQNKTTFKGRDLQKQFDLEAQATISSILSNSLVLRESEEALRIFREIYGLTITTN
ncbi:hypothetical protein [uncultured phage_Deep1-GF2-KM23-C739]|uniref:Uncharacterized protein n=1 Tax=uncultured phage_Deep1-GF2-KM23-C739 TaxID=2740798 RepID=A0A1B1IW20_9CAUD|nr:hypothetical protein HOU05_gp44 [uncultured phage_Deep1-GF2-KM23-C739]ANS05514.1 hypothetical protein [uncultured phage_Deep1-GF2-KM23-C739]